MKASTMNPPSPVLQPVQPSDFDAMVALRIAALRESLERLGRFDPVRAGERLAAGFAPPHMHHIVVGGERVGFVTLRLDSAAQPPSLRIDHLYLLPIAQGQGIGTWVLDWAKAQAVQRQCDITQAALKQSEANRFYLRHGFVPTGDSAFDTEYRWSVIAAVAA